MRRRRPQVSSPSFRTAFPARGTRSSLVVTHAFSEVDRLLPCPSLTPSVDRPHAEGPAHGGGGADIPQLPRDPGVTSPSPAGAPAQRRITQPGRAPAKPGLRPCSLTPGSAPCFSAGASLAASVHPLTACSSPPAGPSVRPPARPPSVIQSVHPPPHPPINPSVLLPSINYPISPSLNHLPTAPSINRSVRAHP